MPAIDNTQGRSATFSARDGIVVTPSNSVDLTDVTRALYVGGAGNVAVVMAGSGDTLVITGVPAGAFLPISVTRVNSTSTTATNIVAFW